jgi:hypothetical protein
VTVPKFSISALTRADRILRKEGGGRPDLQPYGALLSSDTSVHPRQCPGNRSRMTSVSSTFVPFVLTSLLTSRSSAPVWHLIDEYLNAHPGVKEVIYVLPVPLLAFYPHPAQSIHACQHNIVLNKIKFNHFSPSDVLKTQQAKALCYLTRLQMVDGYCIAIEMAFYYQAAGAVWKNPFCRCQA